LRLQVVLKPQRGFASKPKVAPSAGLPWVKCKNNFPTSKRLWQNFRRQEQHHCKKGFQDELLALLRKHKVEYDERYLWD